jgi:hypothetical protein
MFNEKTIMWCVTMMDGQRLILVDIKEVGQIAEVSVILGLNIDEVDAGGGKRGLNVMPYPVFDLPGMLSGPHTVNLATIEVFHKMSENFKKNVLQIANVIYTEQIRETSGLVIASSLPSNISTFNPPHGKR